MSETLRIRVHSSAEQLPRERQLAHRLAVLAAGSAETVPEVAEMVINRIIENTAVAIASLNRAPVVAARAQALAHAPSRGGRGALIYGVADRVSAEWAAWANGVAVRELDFHDTFLAADYSHPGDNVPPILAVAQHLGSNGSDLIRAIATGYEIQIALVKAISLHRHRIDHIAHLGPSVAGGLGTLLRLDADTIFQAIGQALHTTTQTRQSRKGEISTWKAYAPAFAGKVAIEAVDRAMRGQTSPVPIYEGEDGVIAWLLDGPEAEYHVTLPGAGEPRLGILDSYPKEHSAEYQAQALIDLARRLHNERPELRDPENVVSVLIRTSHHTHSVIGSGANDPQKYDPAASRETLDHSIPYIFAVALQDGVWHHVDSYAPTRAARPDTVKLWQKISTVEDPEWTRRYHSADIAEKAFGGSVVITLRSGEVIEDEIAVADAHPRGARPFDRDQYIAKFVTLAGEHVSEAERDRFLDTVQRLSQLQAGQLDSLNILAKPGGIVSHSGRPGLF